MFRRIIVKEMTIHKVLKTMRVGNDFLILAHINNDEVPNVKKCNHHISLLNTNDASSFPPFVLNPNGCNGRQHEIFINFS